MKPLLDVVQNLEKVKDFHSKSLHRVLTRKVRQEGSETRLGSKLMLGHVPKTPTSEQRPAVLLAPGILLVFINILNANKTLMILIMLFEFSGMHVILKSSEVCLFLAAQRNAQGTVDAWVLRLEPKNLSSASVTNVDTRGSIAVATESTKILHPDLKLPWFDRRPNSEMRKVPSHDILMKVRVAPCLYIDDEDNVCNNGYLLSHGIFNYDLRGKNEKLISTPVAQSTTRPFSSSSEEASSTAAAATATVEAADAITASNDSSSSSSSSSSPSAASSASTIVARIPRRQINGPKPKDGETIRVNGSTFVVRSVADSNIVDDNKNAVFYIYVRDPNHILVNNFFRSTEQYEIVSGKGKK